MEDNRQIDTSPVANPNNAETAFEAPVTPESSTDTNLTVEDAFFGASETQPQDTPPSQEQAPQAQEIPPTQTGTQSKNDEKRFEYWQSQAAQRENELQSLRAQIGQQQTAPPTQAQVPTEEPQAEAFPPPPDKPQKPHGYSREDAWGDQTSESARYLDEMETWQEDIVEYNSLKSQYDVALMQERVNKVEEERSSAMRQREAQIQEHRQLSEIQQYVTGHHGFSNDEAQEFIHSMSDPNSISMDNLVALYRMQKGGTQAPANAAPSPAFQQTQQAQQIPSPMGVMPASGQTGRSDSDQIMDSLIGDYNSGNPWK